MGLILTTRGWLGASITWTHASGADTYSVSGDVHNAYDVATALVDWLADIARPWFTIVTGFSFAVSTDTDIGLRHCFPISYTGSFDAVDPGGSWRTFFGDPLDRAVGTEGTLAENPGLIGWLRVNTEPGVRCREGSYRVGCAQTAPQRPKVEWWLDERGAHVLSQALRYGAVPRTAYIYDEDASTWRWVTLGEMRAEHPGDDVTLIRFAPEVLGGGVR